MRFLLPAAAFLLALSALAGWGRASGASSGAAPPSAAAPAKPAGAGSSADNEAAAKHAKRTACINQARARKLVGAQKTAFIKSCIGAP